MNRWLADQIAAFRKLPGKSIARWVGTEMALREAGPTGLPQFDDPAIPFLQLLQLFADCGDAVLRIGTYQNNAAWGLHIEGLPAVPEWPAEAGSIFRERDLTVLPTGLIQGSEPVLDSSGDLVEVTLRFAAGAVVLRAGEVYEELGGVLRVVSPDESVLVSVVPGVSAGGPGWRLRLPG